MARRIPCRAIPLLPVRVVTRTGDPRAGRAGLTGLTVPAGHNRMGGYRGGGACCF
jgi:hypothetical protein